MPQGEGMQAVGTILSVAAELAFFNQWILQERRPSGITVDSAPLLVTLYAVSDKISPILLSKLPDHGEPALASVLFLPHLVVGNIATLFIECTPFEESDKKKSRGATTGQPISRVWDMAILAAPVATAAWSNSVLFALVSRTGMTGDQTSTAVLAWAYTVFLFCRFGDLVVCQRMNRPMFIGQHGASTFGYSLSMLMMMLAARAALTWMFGLGSLGIIESNVMQWLIHFTPQDTTVESGIVEQAASTSTDLAPYGVKLSDYKGLTQKSPYEIDLKFNIGYVATALIHTGTTLTIGAAVAGCVLLHGVHPLALTFCIVTALGTAVVYAGKVLAHTHHKKTIGTYFFGNRKITTRASIDSSNYDYLSALHDDKDSFQVGWMEKDMGYGAQRSPIYRVNSTEGDLHHFHFTAFYNEDTEMMEHMMEFADEPIATALEKRVSYEPYNEVKKADYGLMFQFCPFHTSASSPSWDQSVNSVYSRVQDQDSCLQTDSDYGKARSILVDYYNNNGVVIGSINLAPYKSGGSANHQGLTQCTTRLASVNEDCIRI